METATAVLERPAPSESQQEVFTRIPTPYPEFHGPGGDRYLKKLLRQILPMALYRTWEIYVDYQARGNDCFLSLSQLALAAGRSVRTMQKNVACLQARHLLVERVERKSFPGPDGHCRSRMVIVKDFTALYALAHEYHEWLHTESMLPPERAFLPLLEQNPSLVAKLRRFDNYRRLLYHHHPDPAQQAQEEDRWFTGYRSGTVGNTLGSHAPVSAKSNHAPSHATLLEPKAPSKEVSKMTPKRISESSQRDDPSGDSFDSASPFSASSGKRENAGAHMEHAQPTHTKGEEAEGRTLNVPPKPPTTPGHASRTRQSLTQYSAPSREIRKTLSHTKPTTQGACTQTNQHSPPQQWRDQPPGESVMCAQPPDHPLVHSFLQKIAVPFGDRNPKGSLTRLLNILAHASLEEAEVVLCLVRAYTIARDTRTIRSVHSEPGTGQANRMPLFCTLFERFVQARLHSDTWKYSWQQWEEDVAADDRLFSWWTEHRESLAPKAPDLFGSQIVPESKLQEENGNEKEDCSRTVGWAHREAAHSWGERLAEALMVTGYEAEVRVHLEKQWYQLLLVGDGFELVLSSPQMVLEAIKIIKYTDCNETTNR